jgi:hypothetical protein
MRGSSSRRARARCSRPLERRNVRRHGSPFLLPLGAATVEHSCVREPEELENPERVGGPPIVLVAVEHDGRFVVDTLRPQELLKLFAAHVVTNHGVVEVGVPVDLLCVRNVAHVVEQHVFVALDDPDRRVVEMGASHSVLTSISGWL